ncbi:MAG: hypothetical protein WBS33_13490 [Verrucomicrobiia bacterium]
MKRGYLLPEGCKDLIDVLKKSKQPSQHPVLLFDLWKLKKPQLVKFKPTKLFWGPSVQHRAG